MRSWAKRAHGFFWSSVAALVPAGAATYAVEGREPGYALDSEWIYRLEVGLAFFTGIHLLTIVLWLAYHGRSIREIQIPGGGMKVPNPDPGLDEAAEGFDEFREHAQTRLDEHDDALDDLDERTAELESRRPFVRRMLGV